MLILQCVPVKVAVEEARQKLGQLIKDYADAVSVSHMAESAWAHARSVVVSLATLASFLTALISIAAASWRVRRIIERTRDDMNQELDRKLAAFVAASSTVDHIPSAAQDINNISASEHRHEGQLAALQQAVDTLVERLNVSPAAVGPLCNKTTVGLTAWDPRLLAVGFTGGLLVTRLLVSQ